MVRLAHAPARSLDFRLVDRDIFQRGQMTVRFRRDPAGTPVAFAYTNPLIRDVTFTRLPERTAAAPRQD